MDPQKAMRRAEPGPPVPAADRDRFVLQTAPYLARLGAPAATSPALVAR